ncbi:hypothetical protein J2Z53_001212 [Clostridium moniliforme]|uniref:Uncharacterized protein n=1 Tax=Clostridium moniliforme TaxID=39489 RepID=A0ABS4F054_9CLOT|nr:hypothetical protein [Clostridium moniliforme]MBP1889629.1 hypothetical protein [Clostridium moniliforme]
MNDSYINIVEAAKELGLKVKLVTAVKSFDTYNSFFNIYGEEEEPCRRIVILTSDSEVEEVYDEDPSKKINNIENISGNIWVKEFPLTTNPKNIKFEDIHILKEEVEKLKKLK